MLGMVTRRGYLLALVVSGCVGLLWTLLNAGSVPLYGDSLEYLHAAQTMQVDQYRTILYPLILRIFGVVSHGESLPFTPWIYAFQWLALALSTALFVYASIKVLRLDWTSRQTFQVTAGATLVVVTNPLIAHFSIALMSDSLASSLTIACIGSLALALPDDRTRAFPQWTWLAAALLLLFLMALSRVDKLYAALVICVTVVAWAICTGRRKARIGGGTTAVAATLLATLVAVVYVNKTTQTYNHDRPPLDVSSLAFNRVVWPHLAETYPYLSPRAKAVISPEDALHFDEHNNHVYLLLTRLLKSDPANRAVINEVTLTTLRRFPAQVAGKAVFDIAKYTLPNIAFPLELVHVLPLSTATDWTHSRMQQNTPRLTDAALWTSQAVFLLGGMPIALVMLLRKGRPPIRWQLIAWLATAAVASNSLLFGLEAGMDAHIRYALPTYTIFQAAVAAMSLAWALTTPRDGQRTATGPSSRTPGGR